MADKIAVTPGGVCAMNAFASSATGQDNYVGFGAKFHPNMPLTTSELGDAYNVSAYDGITFRARTGGGPTTQPVFVEILTKETPAGHRGRHGDGAGDRPLQQPRLLRERRLQHLPAVLRAVRRDDPALAAGDRHRRGQLPGAGGGVPMCQAPKFDPTNALAIQFSFYGPMDTPGFPTPSPVGSYNLVIDDVAFYKRSALPSGMSDLPALPSGHGRDAGQRVPAQPAPVNGCFKAAGLGRQADRPGLRQLEGQVRARRRTAATASCARRPRPGAARTPSPKVSPTRC